MFVKGINECMNIAHRWLWGMENEPLRSCGAGSMTDGPRYGPRDFSNRCLWLQDVPWA